MTSPAKKIIVVDVNRPRLDIFLSQKLNISRSQAQKMISKGQITLNGKKPTKTGERVKKGDEIVISKPSRDLTSILSFAKERQSQRSLASLPRSAGREERAGRGLARLAMTPSIIASTPDYIIVNKPTGLLTHPTQANEKNTLVDFLVKKYPEIKKVGDPAQGLRPMRGKFPPSVRPGIVHRLDKEASGLLVVARTQKMFNHLKEQFKKRTIEKEYLALVHGKVAKDWDEINFPIARSSTSDRMAARPVMKPDLTSILSSHEERQNQPPPLLSKGEDRVRSRTVDETAKEARTEFFVEKRFINFTLLRVIIHTGRMHQIRAHMLAYNHPLVGDPLYFQKKRKSKWDEKLGRLFLHSTTLAFTDLEGDKQTFESSLPKKLKEFLKLLK